MKKPIITLRLRQRTNGETVLHIGMHGMFEPLRKFAGKAYAKPPEYLAITANALRFSGHEVQVFADKRFHENLKTLGEEPLEWSPESDLDDRIAGYSLTSGEPIYR